MFEIGEAGHLRDVLALRLSTLLSVSLYIWMEVLWLLTAEVQIHKLQPL